MRIQQGMIKKATTTTQQKTRTTTKTRTPATSFLNGNSRLIYFIIKCGERKVAWQKLVRKRGHYFQISKETRSSLLSLIPVASHLHSKTTGYICKSSIMLSFANLLALTISALVFISGAFAGSRNNASHIAPKSSSCVIKEYILALQSTRLYTTCC